MLNVVTNQALARLNDNLTPVKAGVQKRLKKTGFRLPQG
jgi:hypothetical protein